jgi:hypothetical protein
VRLHFKTLTRAKHLAERLETVFPALSHMKAQEWAAQILGYRNWHELAESVGPDVEETADYVISRESLLSDGDSEGSKAFFKRSLEQRDTLRRLIGHPVPDMTSLFFRVDPNYPDVRFKKLGKTGKGTPCFKGFAYDLFSHEGEKPGVGGGKCERVGSHDNALYVYSGLPEGRDEAEFLAQLKKRMTQGPLPYRGYEKQIQTVLHNEHFEFGFTHFDVEESEAEPGVMWAAQSRWYRFFLMEGEQPVGAVVLKFEASASSDSNSIEVEVTIDEAWSAYDDDADEVFDALSVSLIDTIAEPLRRLMWFRVGNPALTLNVGFLSESESPLTWDLVNALKTDVPDYLVDMDDDIGPDALEGMSFDAMIAP